MRSFLSGALLALVPLGSSSSIPTTYSTCSQSMNGALPASPPSDFSFSGNVRRYYVAAEQVTWDYAPTGWDNALGVPLEYSPRARYSGIIGSGSLGTKWQKALYRGYTDASFSHLSTQPTWNGNNGPILRAEVGDMIEIMFVNKLPNIYASMHSMGLAYNKDNEGSLYPNNSQPGQNVVVAPGNSVAPGGCVVYKWLVNEGAAPTKGLPSHMWGYHSYISYEQDQNAGLTGNTIVYARGQMDSTMANYREFVLTYMQFVESFSSMSATNRAMFSKDNNMGAVGQSSPDNQTMLPSPQATPGNQSVWQPQVTNFMAALNQLSTQQAPTFSAHNGFIYANNPPYEVCVNDPTIWYVSAYGNNPHTFHMHGNGFVHQGENLASISKCLQLTCLFMRNNGLVTDSSQASMTDR